MFVYEVVNNNYGFILAFQFCSSGIQVCDSKASAVAATCVKK